MKHGDCVALTMRLSHVEVPLVQVRTVNNRVSHGSTWCDSRRASEEWEISWAGMASRGFVEEVGTEQGLDANSGWMEMREVLSERWG